MTLEAYLCYGITVHILKIDEGTDKEDSHSPEVSEMVTKILIW